MLPFSLVDSRYREYMDLVLASHNHHKQQEFSQLCTSDDVHIVTLDDIGQKDFTIPETRDSFVGNATQKVETVSTVTNLAILADDSGLVVDALDGRPGVFSARYSPGSDADRCQKILAQMQGKKDRTAHFVCVLAFMPAGGGEIRTFEGKVDGTIALAASSQVGFGYDPIFIPDGYTQTFEQLSATVKNTISHRARAFEKFFKVFVEKSLQK